MRARLTREGVPSSLLVSFRATPYCACLRGGGSWGEEEEHRAPHPSSTRTLGREWSHRSICEELQTPSLNPTCTPVQDWRGSRGRTSLAAQGPVLVELSSSWQPPLQAPSLNPTCTPVQDRRGSRGRTSLAAQGPVLVELSSSWQPPTNPLHRVMQEKGPWLVVYEPVCDEEEAWMLRRDQAETLFPCLAHICSRKRSTPLHHLAGSPGSRQGKQLYPTFLSDSTTFD